MDTLGAFVPCVERLSSFGGYFVWLVCIYVIVKPTRAYEGLRGAMQDIKGTLDYPLQRLVLFRSVPDQRASRISQTPHKG